MPAVSQNVATVTADIGNGDTVTTGAYTGMSGVSFDFANGTMQLHCAEGNPIFDISGATTFTLTLTAGVYALTVS